MSCKVYIAQRDKNGFPIPGTMMSLPNNKGICHNCGEIVLPTAPMKVSTGQKQVRHPQGLRFFIRLDCSGNIIPNSLFSTRSYPVGSRVLEYIKIVSA